MWRERAMAAELVAKMLQRNLDDLRANVEDLRRKVEAATAADAEAPPRDRVVGTPVAALRARSVRQVPRLTAVGKKKTKPRRSEQLEEVRRLLDDVLVAQHRTNHLLELALRAGFDDDEHARSARPTQEDSP